MNICGITSRAAARSKRGVVRGSHIAGRVLMEQLKFTLDYRCSYNQAERLAIVKALEVIETQ